MLARQTETYARLTAARAGQGLPERSSPEARPSNTPTPRKKNQGVKRNAGAPRTAIMTKSWMAPQTTKVATSASADGTARFSGEIGRASCRERVCQYV